MPKERRQTLRGSFLRVTIPLIFLTVIGVFGVIELMTHRSAVNRLEQTLESMIATQSAALATPLWNLDHEQIKGFIAESNLSPLMRPADLVQVEEIPKLGSGKKDFSRARQIALEQCPA